jgi:hypothetical protein
MEVESKKVEREVVDGDMADLLPLMDTIQTGTMPSKPGDITDKLVAKKKHHWSYYVLMVFLIVVMLVGAAWLVYTSYLFCVSWYNGQISATRLQGYQDGVNHEQPIAYQAGLTSQQTQDGKLLARTKADDAQLLSKVKAMSYNSGMTDEARLIHTWWASHCSFDQTINRYVCSSAP